MITSRTSATTEMAAKTTIRSELEPVLAFPFIQQELERTEPDGKEQEPPVIDFHLLPLHVRRVLDHDDVHDDREDADGNIDIEDPSPGPVVRDPASEERARDRTEHGAEAEDGHGRAVFFPGKLSSRIDWLIGTSPPPPSPCRTRKKTRLPRLQAEPHMKELNVKSAIEAI